MAIIKDGKLYTELAFDSRPALHGHHKPSGRADRRGFPRPVRRTYQNPARGSDRRW
jgi:hypothetical protein